MVRREQRRVRPELRDDVPLIDDLRLAVAALVEATGRVAAPWTVDFYSIDEFVGVVFLMRSLWSSEEIDEACALMRRFVTT